jgi:hypothetical protein
MNSSSRACWNKEAFDVIGISQVKDSLDPGTQINIENKDARES